MNLRDLMNLRGMSTRTRAILSGVLTVVILAAVIGGIYAFSSPRNEPTQLPRERLSDQAYQQGLDALASKDTTGAVELFQRAILFDSKNESAKNALEDAKAQQAQESGSSGQSSGSSTSGGQGSGGSSSGGTEDPWSKAVSPKTLLPTQFPDYALGGVQTVGPDATVSGSPMKTGAKITSIVWSAHDAETSAKSSTYLNSVTKTLYSKDSASINVNGVPAYFGTDGTRFAAVAYARNRYVFEVVLTSSDPPASAKSIAEQAAAVFATQL